MSRNVKLGVLYFAVAVASLFLCGTSAHAGDKEDLVGRWNNPVIDSAYIRFFPDGTFKEVALLTTTEGKWRIVDKGVIELDVPGLVFGRNVAETKFRLNGDTLELMVLGEWVKYKRAK